MILKELTYRFGGLWRYPKLKDYFFLVNPYFPDKKILIKLKKNFANLVTQYPSNLKSQNILASKLFNVHEKNLIVCNGVSEVINILPKIFKGKFGIFTPTFNEYIDAIGKERIFLKEVKNTSFRYASNELYGLSKKCRNIILINPDNPSGNLISKSELLKFLNYLKIKKKNLIIDESFIDFSNKKSPDKMLSQKILTKYQNLLVIKSIGKSFGVAGIRLGVVGSSNNKLLSEIKTNLAIWNINSFAETFLEIMPKYLPTFEIACNKIIDERKIFFKELEKIKFLEPLPSFSNYIMCKISNKFSSDRLSKKLLNEGYLVKSLSKKIDPKRGEYIRLTVRNRNDNKKLIKVLQKFE